MVTAWRGRTGIAISVTTVEQLTIRRATGDDLDGLLELCAEYSAADGHIFDPARTRAGVEPLLADDTLGVILLATVDGQARGYGVVTWGWSIEAGGLDVVLDEVYTRTPGVGIGSRLIEAIEERCRARDVRRIFLETERPNEGARRLYRRHGYTVDDSIWMSKELC